MTSICVGFFTAIHSLDPHRAQDYAAGQVIEQLFEAPYRQSDGGAPEPVIFTAQLTRERVGNRMKLSGQVRPGLVFSDGSAVTAREVVDSLRLAGPIAARAEIEGSGADVTFWLERDDPRLEEALSRRWCSIAAPRGDDLIGTGPFRIRGAWTPEEIALERNPHARRQPVVDELVFRVYATTKNGNPEGLEQAIAAGEVDLTTVLGRDHAAKLSGVRKVFQPGSSTSWVAFNVEHPLLADVAVRQALCQAIDRTSVAALSYDNPHAFVARSVLPPYMWRKGDGVRPDRDKASEDLAKIGIALERPLKLLTMWGPRPYLPQPALTARAVADQFAAVGVPCQVVTTRDSMDYCERTEAGRYDLDLTGWIADTPDPYDFLAATFASEAVPLPGQANSSSNNMSRYRSAEMDAALTRHRQEGGDARLQEVMDLVSRDAPCCPLFHGPTIIVHAWRLQNVAVSAIGMPDLANAGVE